MATVVDYSPADVQRLATSYASAVANTPHCHPEDGTVAQWQAELATLPQEATAEGTGECSHRRIMLAESEPGGQLLGFVDVCVWPAHQATEWGPESTGTRVDVPPRGLIRFLWYERGARAAGVALVEAAEAHFASMKLHEFQEQKRKEDEREQRKQEEEAKRVQAEKDRREKKEEERVQRMKEAHEKKVEAQARKP